MCPSLYCQRLTNGNAHIFVGKSSRSCSFFVWIWQSIMQFRWCMFWVTAELWNLQIFVVCTRYYCKRSDGLSCRFSTKNLARYIIIIIACQSRKISMHLFRNFRLNVVNTMQSMVGLNKFINSHNAQLLAYDYSIFFIQLISKIIDKHLIIAYGKRFMLNNRLLSKTNRHATCYCKETMLCKAKNQFTVHTPSRRYIRQSKSKY